MATAAEDRVIPGGRWTRLELPGGESLEIVVPPSGDLIGDVVQRLGGYFPEPFELALGMLEPRAVVLDLGAHLGTFSLAAAARGHRVISVEASPRNAEFLRESARANGFGDEDLLVVHVAVSDKPGTVRFRPEGAWGQITEGWAPGLVEVPAQTVPDVLREAGVPRVDFVKLDVEGSEIAVVSGMRDLLTGPDAPPVVYESNAHTLRMFGATPEDLVGVFAGLGYDNYLIGERELMPVTPQSFQPDTCVDYLGVKGGLVPPPDWTVRHPRTESELARVVAHESTLHIVDARAQVARSLARAPDILLARRDVQLALDALALDPDDAVARAAAWWPLRAARARADDPTAADMLHSLAELGRALHDRVAQIRIRWGFRP
jgi:FkbM family methyltransferase